MDSYDRLKPTVHTQHIDGGTLRFTAERFPNTPLLDTMVEGEISFCITWADKEKFVSELEDLLERYRI
jgi:hypothetical protein